MKHSTFTRACALLLLASCVLPAARAATVPTGFVESTWVDLPDDVTAMEFAPDGRLFVARQSGQVRIVRDGVLVAQPFLTLPVDSNGERGVLAIAFDPAFANNDFVYVYYTARTPSIHNRVSRFRAQGDVAVAGSEEILFELPTVSAQIHNGGAIHFGNDGHLYVAVGDDGNGDNSQSLASRFGKLLRIDRDGSIPTDNPFYATTTGDNRAIWAYGLRNPFTFAVQRSSGRMFVNDVGRDTWEEIDPGQAGANYGWPLSEGPTSDPRFVSPVHAYAHDGTACAITGGTFYEPPVQAFPAGYHGQYFFADFCGHWIRRLNPQTFAVTDFASGLRGQPVDLEAGPDGALYYLARNPGRVGRIAYETAQAPTIRTQPADRTVTVGQSATFRVSASGSAPLSFQWRRNGAPIPGATGASYTLTNARLADDGASFDAVVTNAFGQAVSEAARLTVLQNAAPRPAITQPARGATYAGGQLVRYAGTASDAEDGTLPAAAFTWWVTFHHDDHFHPFVAPRTGARSGSFRIPVTGETSANVFYRIHLRVRDSAGLTRTITRDLQPRKVTVTLATQPAGLRVRLDGRAVTTPHQFVGVVGIERRIEAISPQTRNGTTWLYTGWSDGGARNHVIRTPASDRTYTARYRAQ